MAVVFSAMVSSSISLPKQCVLLAGGLGSRMSEVTSAAPKPLIMANGEPLIRHVMRIYEDQGVRNFLILAGYLSSQVHQYFSSLISRGGYITYSNEGIFRVPNPHQQLDEFPSVTVVETGLHTQTAGRLLAAQGLLEEAFFLSYSDSFAQVDLARLAELHRERNNLVTLTAVQQPSRFGQPVISGDKVLSFTEKATQKSDYISGGFMVVSKSVVSLISSLDSSFEYDVLPQLAASGKLGAHQHEGDFFAVDSLRDLRNFEAYLQGRA